MNGHNYSWMTNDDDDRRDKEYIWYYVRGQTIINYMIPYTCWSHHDFCPLIILMNTHNVRSFILCYVPWLIIGIRINIISKILWWLLICLILRWILCRILRCLLIIWRFIMSLLLLLLNWLLIISLILTRVWWVRWILLIVHILLIIIVILIYKICLLLLLLLVMIIITTCRCWRINWSWSIRRIIFFSFVCVEIFKKEIQNNKKGTDNDYTYSYAWFLVDVLQEVIFVLILVMDHEHIHSYEVTIHDELCLDVAMETQNLHFLIAV